MPGKYFLGTSLASAGTIANWVVDNSKYNNLDRKKAYDMLSKKAEKIYPGSDGLFCFPFCNGVRSPVVNSTARGAFIGFDLSHKTEHLLRAVYEGISYSIRHSLESLEASNFIVKDISVCGGGSKSSLLTHILADVVGKPLHISFPEASLLGSAICAAVGAERYKNLDEAISYMVHPTGVILPDTTNHEVYSDYFEKYKLSFYDIFAKEVAA